MFRFNFIFENVLFWWSIGKSCEVDTIYGWLHTQQKSCQPHTIYRLHSIPVIKSWEGDTISVQLNCTVTRFLFS